VKLLQMQKLERVKEHFTPIHDGGELSFMEKI